MFLDTFRLQGTCIIPNPVDREMLISAVLGGSSTLLVPIIAVMKKIVVVRWLPSESIEDLSHVSDWSWSKYPNPAPVSPGDSVSSARQRSPGKQLAEEATILPGDALYVPFGQRKVCPCPSLSETLVFRSS